MSGVLLLLAAALPAQDLVPPRISLGAPSPRWQKLLARQTRFILAERRPGVPNELEHALRPLTGTVFSAAVCVKFGACDDTPEVTAAIASILTDVTRTHLSGGGVTATGRAWGHQWQSAFWAWQAAFGAWLVADRLPPALRTAVVRMMIDEADRFLDLPPPYAEHYDTKAEENAWNSLVLALAAETQRGHAHSEGWRRRSLEYMISAFATRADRTSARAIDGRPLRDWVRGVNLHSDYTLENHGFVHPDYMTTTSLNLVNEITWKLAGAAPPAAARHHAAEVYENLKWLTLPDGGLLYINGTDWNLHRVDETATLHAQMERVMRDPEAGALEGIALDTLERMQARNTAGRTFVPGEFPSYPGHEEHAAWLYAVGLMNARLWDAPANRRAPAQVWSRLQGPRLFEDGRFFVLRTPAAISSFSWGLRIMGMTVPFAVDTVLNPVNHSYVGMARAPEPAGESAGRLGIGSAALERALAEDAVTVSTVIPAEENGALHVTANTRHGGAGHVFSFTALPGGQSVYMERWSGGHPLGALVSLLEDDRWVHGGPRADLQTDGNTWLHTAGLGYAVSRGGGIRTIADIRNRLVALNAEPSADAAVVTLPGASRAATQQFAASPWRLTVRHPDISAVHVDRWIVATNFSPHPLTVEADVDGAVLRIPINGYSTRVLPAQRR